MQQNKEGIAAQLLEMANLYIAHPLKDGLLKGTSKEQTTSSLTFVSEPDDRDERDELLEITIVERLGLLCVSVTVEPGWQERLVEGAEFCFPYITYEDAARHFQFITEAIKATTLMPKG